MKNPYINNQSNFDNKINKAASNLPIVPENFNTSGFLKGALIGAGVTYLLTNPKAQETLFKAIVKAGNLLQASLAELQERFEDAKAEQN